MTSTFNGKEYSIAPEKESFVSLLPGIRAKRLNTVMKIKGKREEGKKKED